MSIIIILVILIIIPIISYIPKYKESVISSEIEEANYCDIDSDCAYAGSKCPFGCYIYVNVDEVDRIKALVDSFESRCVYGCLRCDDVVCVNNRCKEVCE